VIEDFRRRQAVVFHHQLEIAHVLVSNLQA
jgi:hypothetical protein